MAAVLVGLALLVAGCAGHRDSASSIRPSAKGWTAKLGVGSTGGLRVTMAAPQADRDRALAQIEGLTDPDVSGVVHVRLTGGHLGPGGAILARRLVRPVPRNETATLMYFDPRTAIWRTVPSFLSADRQTVRARVHHFSDWTTAILYKGADLLGLRVDAPDCGKAPRPAWVDTVTFVEDENAPLRVCVAGDAIHRDRVLVKVAVNRGYGVSMHTAIAPTSTSVDLGAGPIDLIVDGVVRIPALYALSSKHDRQSVPVLAGQTVTYTFTEAQIRAVGDHPLVQAWPTVPEAAAGAIFGLIVGKVTDSTGDQRIARAGAYLGANLIVAQCVGEIAVPFSQGRWTTAVSGARKCFSSTASTVATITARSLAQAFPEESETKLAGIAARVGKALKALGIISISLDATEWLNDHRLDEAGFQVHVFPKLTVQPFVRCGDRGADNPAGGYSAIIQNLRARGVDCVTALKVAAGATYNGHPAGWTCEMGFPSTRCRKPGAVVIWVPGGDAG